jgi:hypothetical protein
MSAKEYNLGIRAHWSVESMHYIKDVIPFPIKNQKVRTEIAM